jgi:hypothetical protein
LQSPIPRRHCTASIPAFLPHIGPTPAQRGTAVFEPRFLYPQVLKLSKEKWDEARDHAMRAVVADNRMRIWYADKGTMEVGLLFVCRLGNVDLDRPVG